MLNLRLQGFTFGPLFPEPEKAQADFGNKLAFAPAFSLCSTIAKTPMTIQLMPALLLEQRLGNSSPDSDSPILSR